MDLSPPSEDAAPSSAIRRGLFGALQKVTSRLTSEDAEDARRLDAEFERQWLAEFERLRTEYASRWDTCTHEADDFCGLLLHSSDAQQREYLLREFPTIMEPWRDADLSVLPTRVWPAATIANNASVDYKPVVTAPEPTQRVEASQSLLEALAVLRTECHWSKDAVQAFTLRLEKEQIFSCAELLACMAKRRGAHFEHNFQSLEYPRLYKSIIRKLQAQAQRLEKRDESVRELSMEPLRVNPQ